MKRVEPRGLRDSDSVDKAARVDRQQEIGNRAKHHAHADHKYGFRLPFQCPNRKANTSRIAFRVSDFEDIFLPGSIVTKPSDHPAMESRKRKKRDSWNDCGETAFEGALT